MSREKGPNFLDTPLPAQYIHYIKKRLLSTLEVEMLYFRRVRGHAHGVAPTPFHFAGGHRRSDSDSRWPAGFYLRLGFLAPQCMELYADKIRNYFQPSEEYERFNSQAVDRIRQGAEVVVGVHLQPGDHWRWKGGQNFFSGPRYTTFMRE